MKLKRALALLLALSAIGTSAAPETTVRRYCSPTEAAITVPAESGFCFDGFWTPGIVTDATYWLPPPIHFSGRALYQEPGVAEATAALMGYDTSDVQGLISLLSPVTAGWRVNVFFPTRPEWGWLLVMDVDAVEQAYYYPHIIYNHSPIELSYALAQATGDIEWLDPVTGDRYFDVEVCISLQPEVDCAGDPVSYERWFESIFRLK